MLINQEKVISKVFVALQIILLTVTTSFAQLKPVRLGIAGLSHGHVGWLLARKDSGDIQIVGIAESDKQLAKRLADQYGFSMSMVYPTVEEMIAAAKPEAVAAFGNIDDHLSVVEACAPRGIHVMVEKPLAINLEHAKQMEVLANKYHIQLLTDYETSWYPTNVKAYDLLAKGTIGKLRKVVIRDGHKGFKGVTINPEFTRWLIDPALSGGGAIMDFGCYGANIMTWLQQGRKPNSVTAVTQQLQPDTNPKVEDDATIILKYDDAMAILEPSWDWPIGRKDMELYGITGVIYVDNGTDLRVRRAVGYDGFTEDTFHLKKRMPPFDDPFSVFASTIRGQLKLERYDPYSLENNMITMEILAAAIKSAESQTTVQIQE